MVRGNFSPWIISVQKALKIISNLYLVNNSPSIFCLVYNTGTSLYIEWHSIYLCRGDTKALQDTEKLASASVLKEIQW